MVQYTSLIIKHNNVYPKRIVFYRDGVDEGQFENVLSHELNALKSACKRIDSKYAPLITLVIVQKRHHIRFFPIDKDDKVFILI